MQYHAIFLLDTYRTLTHFPYICQLLGPCQMLINSFVFFNFRLVVERLMCTCLVPYTLEPTDRMKRLFELYGTVDDNAVR